MTSSISRRSFVSAAAAAMVTAYAGSAQADQVSSDKIWDAEYDVVVVGYGIAGGTAAAYASKNGAKVLLVDSAPKGEEGGNSRYCGQVIHYSKDLEALKRYQMAMAGNYDVDEAVIDAFIQGIGGVIDELHELGFEEPIVWSDYIADDSIQDKDPKIERLFPGCCPEYPELDGSECVDLVTCHVGVSDAALYLGIQDYIEADENVEVWLESPARRLVQDAQTGQVVGVVVEHEGLELSIGAKGGVILSCGGFEDNQEMIQNYLGIEAAVPYGGIHNMGDGIKMAIGAGADLWHMENYESGHGVAESYYLLKPGTWHVSDLISAQGASMLVGEDGSRFANETAKGRHGHIYTNGLWKINKSSNRPWLVFDAAQKQAYVEDGKLPAEDVEGFLVSAPDVEGLAEAIGADPEILAREIKLFNLFAEQGDDYKFGRDPQSMRPFDEGELWAAPMIPGILNTQGGPRRNAEAQVVGVDGEPIAHLYSAGELGGLNAHYYNAGGNVAECLVFGKIAGENAATNVE